ncbi:hypothetical protein J4E91_007622 [Alternaria rosae]|nr:hypothetical protein J4E91_007622 [Alternaria rosae]
MPPDRTEKKNSVAKAAPSRRLAAFGFIPAPKEEVVAAAARVKPSVVSQLAAVQSYHDPLKTKKFKKTKKYKRRRSQNLVFLSLSSKE